MKKTALSFGALATACASAFAIDFTPHPTQNSQGFLRAFFLDGKTRYVVNLPPKTTISGDPARALLYLNDLEGATFSIAKSPMTPEAVFREPDLQKYRMTALAQAGPPERKATVKSEESDPLPINGWTSFRFTVAFQVPGRRFLQRVTFLNFTQKEQWMLVTTAPEKRFEEADGCSWAIFRSWRKLDAAEDLSAPVYP